MSESTDALLRRAHELIEDDQLEQAQAALAPLLEAESNNPALWWVYAHAVTESAIGAAALDRALQLDPTYPGARELKAELVSAQGGLVSGLDSGLHFASAQSEQVDDSNIDDWEAIKPGIEETSANARAGRGFVLIIVALLILASSAVLVLSGAIEIDEILSLFSQATDEPVIVVVEPSQEASATDSPVTPESTNESSNEVTNEATNEATATASAIPLTATDEATNAAAADSLSATDEPTDAASADSLAATGEPTPESTSEPTVAAEEAMTPTVTATATLSPSNVESFIELVVEQIGDLTIDASRSAARETQLGMTIDIFICSAPGPEFNTRLGAVMDAAANLHESMPTQVEAFAVSLLNCADPDDNARTIGVDRSILDDFATGEIEAEAFQQAWRLLE